RGALADENPGPACRPPGQTHGRPYRLPPTGRQEGAGQRLRREGGEVLHEGGHHRIQAHLEQVGPLGHEPDGFQDRGRVVAQAEGAPLAGEVEVDLTLVVPEAAALGPDEEPVPARRGAPEAALGGVTIEGSGLLPAHGQRAGKGDPLHGSAPFGWKRAFGAVLSTPPFPLLRTGG